MRVAAISDLHGNLAATEAVLTEIDRLKPAADLVVCLGDIVGHFSHPNEVIGLLQARDVRSIRGNYDEAVIRLRANSGADFPDEAAQRIDEQAVAWTREQLSRESTDYLLKLPADARTRVTPGGLATGPLQESASETRKNRGSFLSSMLLGGLVTNLGKQPARLQPRRLLFVHGSPRDLIENIYPTTAASILRSIAFRAEADIIVHGHTHQPYQRVVEAVAFVGPGSAGWPLVAGRAEFAVLTIKNNELDVDFNAVEYDAEREASDLQRSRMPSELARLLRTGSQLQAAR